jgi:hypothetical protein
MCGFRGVVVITKGLNDKKNHLSDGIGLCHTGTGIQLWLWRPGDGDSNNDCPGADGNFHSLATHRNPGAGGGDG